MSQKRRYAAGIALLVLGVTVVGMLCAKEHQMEATVPAAGEATVPASVDNWGLSFQTEGEAPVGNEIGRAHV